MSEENVKVVLRAHETFDAGDVDGSLACFDPDVTVDFSRRADGRVGRGREYLGEVVGSWMGAWEDWEEEIDEVRDLGSGVYVLATQRGRGKGSGVSIEQRFALLYEVAAGSIVSMTYYPQADEALEAAGLSE